ncbi:MAG: hypothetical protein JST68_10375, partial [Bacteroidetes bacterium]|nr:hypothetical protein [Bacteroidota bacterium]
MDEEKIPYNFRSADEAPVPVPPVGEAWSLMKRKLDENMPVRKWYRRLGLWWWMVVGVVLVGAGVWVAMGARGSAGTRTGAGAGVGSGVHEGKGSGVHGGGSSAAQTVGARAEAWQDSDSRAGAREMVGSGDGSEDASGQGAEDARGVSESGGRSEKSNIDKRDKKSNGEINEESVDGGERKTVSGGGAKGLSEAARRSAGGAATAGSGGKTDRAVAKAGGGAGAGRTEGSGATGTAGSMGTAGSTGTVGVTKRPAGGSAGRRKATAAAGGVGAGKHAKWGNRAKGPGRHATWDSGGSVSGRHATWGNRAKGSGRHANWKDGGYVKGGKHAKWGNGTANMGKNRKRQPNGEEVDNKTVKTGAGTGKNESGAAAHRREGRVRTGAEVVKMGSRAPRFVAAADSMLGALRDSRRAAAAAAVAGKGLAGDLAAQYAASDVGKKAKEAADKKKKDSLRGLKNRPELSMSAGLSLSQVFPVSQQVTASYNVNGKSNILLDYLPAPYFRLYIGEKLYVQAAVKFNSPQYVLPQAVDSTKWDSSLLAGYSSYKQKTDVSINKLYYTNIPLSIHYQVYKGLSLGAGIQYSRL